MEHVMLFQIPQQEAGGGTHCHADGHHLAKVHAGVPGDGRHGGHTIMGHLQGSVPLTLVPTEQYP